MDWHEFGPRMNSLGPWVNAVEYEGRIFVDPSLKEPTLAQSSPRRIRADQFIRAFPEARAVLEFGSLECADTVAMLKRGVEHVTAVEARLENIRRGSFVLELHDCSSRVNLVHGDVESMDLRSLGRHDAVFCTGLLYHLRNPENLLRNVSVISPNLFLQTHYAQDSGRADASCQFAEDYPEPRIRGLHPMSTWLTRIGLIEVLQRIGYTVETVEDSSINGAASITLAARRY